MAALLAVDVGPGFDSTPPSNKSRATSMRVASGTVEVKCKWVKELGYWVYNVNM